jgi:hypothetical protein
MLWRARARQPTPLNMCCMAWLTTASMKGFASDCFLNLQTDLKQTQAKNGIQGCLHITAESQ